MNFDEVDYIWIRRDRKRIDIRGADDWYLVAICEFVGQGGGYGVTDRQIKAIYKEMENRGFQPLLPVEYAMLKWEERRNR